MTPIVLRMGHKQESNGRKEPVTMRSIADEAGVPIVFDGVTYASMRHMPRDIDIDCIEARRVLA